MSNIKVLNETAGGWQKVEYQNLGTTGYRTPEDEAGGAYEERTGKSASHAYSASVGQDDTIAVQNKSTGKIVTREAESNLAEVTGQHDIGERGATADNPSFEIAVRGVDHARTILEEDIKQWEAWQLYGLWGFRCKDAGTGGIVIEGWSETKNEITQETFREPVVGVDDEGNDIVRGYETRTADTVKLAYREASDNAFSQVTCSVEKWTNIELELKIYAVPQSQLLQQARDRTHVTL